MDAQAASHEQAAASQPAPEGAQAEAACVADRLVAAATGTLDLLVIALGERLGYYRLLARREPLTPPGLAAASRTAPRYARDLNRPGYLRLLAEDWLTALPEVQQRLRTAPPARVADIGCGAGWSCIGLARGYPMLRVDGYDLDPASVELARRNIAAAGLADRVRMYHTDITTTTGAGPYDLVTAFECLHDLPYPVPALAAMRRLADRGGTVLIADMKAAPCFTAPGDDLERLLYGFSLLIYLPDSVSSPGSAGTGTVLRLDTIRDYAAQAGYTGVETLPIENDLRRFYHLHP